tara:strand:- start:264 stop:833 length:570 start_codon:yes stop_codon:yes gene_type:complete
MAGKKKNPGLEGLTKIITNIQSGKTGISTVDKQKKSDAVLLSQLKSRAKRNKVSVKPETFDITPKAGSAFDINKKTIMKAKFGGEAMKLTPKQEKLDKNKDGKISGDDFAMMEVGGEATPIMKGKRISERRKKLLLRREKEEMKKDIPVKKMEMGGKVEKYGHGGSVKGSGMSCRGMGEAIKGGGFKIR